MSTGNRVRFVIRVKPGAARDSVGGRWPQGDALIVAVRARAVEGKANAAVCAALARALGVRSRQVRIVTGERGRDKLVEIADAPPETPTTLARLLG